MAFSKRSENNLKKVALRNQGIKLLTKQPVIKNVDVEAIKKQFAENLSSEEKPAKKAAKKVEAETAE
jgi:hypothetical protein